MSYNKEKKRVYLDANKEIIAAKKKAHYEATKEHYLKQKKEYRANNKEKIREAQRKKRLINKLYTLKSNLKNRIRECFTNKGFKKNYKTEEILGCNYNEFKLHLESKFESWMTWENRGNPKDGIIEPNKSWDIDHIIPMASATTEEDIIKLNHYGNLQPLCSYVNRYIKRDKIII